MNTIRMLTAGVSALALATLAAPATAQTVVVVGAPEGSPPTAPTSPLPPGSDPNANLTVALGANGQLVFNHNGTYRLPQPWVISGTAAARIDLLAGHTVFTRIGTRGGAQSYTGSTTVHDGAELELEHYFTNATSNPGNLNSNPFAGTIIAGGLTVEHGGRLTGQGAFATNAAAGDVIFHGVISPHGFPEHEADFAGSYGRFQIGGTGAARTNVLTFASDSLLEIDADFSLPDGVLTNDVIVSTLDTTIEDGAQLRLRLAQREGPTTYLVGRRMTFLYLTGVRASDAYHNFTLDRPDTSVPLPVIVAQRTPIVAVTEMPDATTGATITRDLQGTDGVVRTYTFNYASTTIVPERSVKGDFTFTEDSDTQLTHYLGLTIGEDVTNAFPVSCPGGINDPECRRSIRSALYLEIAQTRGFAEDANTANGRAAADALQRIGDYNPIFTTLLNLPIGAPATEQLAPFFDSLSGELHVGVRGLLTQDAWSVQRSVGRRLSSYEPGGAHIWAEALGGRRQLDDNGEAQTIKEEGYGVLGGIDASLTGPWRVGLAGGWRTVETEGPDAVVGQADIKQWHAMAYTSGGWGSWRGQFGAGVSGVSVETERDVFLVGVIDSHLAADYDGTVAHAFGELSYLHSMGDAVVEPFLGYSFVRAETDGVREVETRGDDDAAALLISGDQNQVSFATLGVKARTAALGRVSLDGLVGWRRGFGDLKLEGLHLMNNREYLQVHGARLSENAAVVEAGVRWQVGGGVSLDAGYDGVIGDEGHDHTARVGMSMRF